VYWLELWLCSGSTGVLSICPDP